MNKYRFVDENRTHLHQINVDGEWKPLIGTSSVLDVLAKNLVWWAAELSAVECLESGEHIPTIRTEYLEAAGKHGPEKKVAMDALSKKYPIFKAARFAHYASKNKKADEGTDLHAELENYVKARIAGQQPLEREVNEKILPFVHWEKQNVKRFIASEGHCYSEEMWVGGVTDLVLEDNQGRIGIMDFKSAKEAYLNHFIQCAGYAIQIAENGVLDKDGNEVYKLERPIDFCSVFPFGAEKPEPQFNFDMKGLEEGFKSALVLKKLINQTN